MSQYTVAIIRENSLVYSELDKNFSRLSHEKVENDLEDYLEFVTVDDTDHMIDLIGKTLKLDKDTLANTSTCYQDDQFIYQICYLESTNPADKNVNRIASQLTRNISKAIGDVVMLKAKIGVDGLCSSHSISLSDVVNVFRQLFIHTGVVVNPDGTVDNTQYVFNPVDWIKTDKINNYKFLEFELFADTVAQMFIELVPDNNILNEKATVVFGKKPIHGRVVFGLRHTQNDIRCIDYDYCEFNRDMFDKLVCIISRQKELAPKSEENKATDKPEQPTKQTVTNFYTILEKNYSKFKTMFKTYQSCLTQEQSVGPTLNDLTKQQLENKQ